MIAMHLFRSLNHLTNRLEYYGWPLLQLTMRIWIANIFWRAGKVKVKHWDATLSLFKFEYKVPFIAPEHAAYFATSMEILCPILLVLGLLTRLATLPLLFMTIMIQITYMSSKEHIYWMFILTVLLLKGAGQISVDAYLNRKSYIY
jgi:putative oxidoreductase